MNPENSLLFSNKKHTNHGANWCVCLRYLPHHFIRSRYFRIQHPYNNSGKELMIIFKLPPYIKKQKMDCDTQSYDNPFKIVLSKVFGHRGLLI